MQLVPHFTGLVCEKIEKASAESDIHIVEIGGTIGDYEGLPFVEAIRLFANKVGRRNCLYVSVVYVPFIHTSNELKTKPAQNALKDLRGFGIIPDVVCVRTEGPAPRAICEKIAGFSGISSDAVVNLPDIQSVYDVPFNVLKSGVLEILNDFVGDTKEPDMKRWKEFSRRRGREYTKTVRVGLVAKYVGNDDTYMCVTEALKAAAAWNNLNLEIKWINAEELGEKPEQVSKILKGCDGIVVPGGFGKRGVEGKIKAARFALTHDVPYLGLCLGLQAACIAAAREGGVKNANSEEFGAKEIDENNVIYIMEGQKGKESTGGTMRLGDYPAILTAKSKTAKIYKKAMEKGEYAYGTEVLENDDVSVIERHRHRYEVNQKFLPQIEKGGIRVVGFSPDGKLVEFIEAPKCKFFVATQAHPEFKSRPLNPHPLFMEFMKSLK